MSHREILVHLGDLEVGIDDGLAPVISELWRRGARTEGCCQGNPNARYGSADTAYIAFADTASLGIFVNAVAIYDDRAHKDWADGLVRRRGVSRVKSIYWRSTLPRTEITACLDNLRPDDRSWRYDFEVWDASPRSHAEIIPIGHVPDFQIVPCVWFPTNDIPLIEKRLLNHGDAK